MDQAIFLTFNTATRRYDRMDPESELAPGMVLIKMFWVNTAGKYVTVPGASLFRVNDSLELVAQQ